MRHSYPYLQQMQEDHLQGYTNYLHQNYDVFAFYPKFTDTNVLSMIRESFVEGLNKRCKLPNCVIILYSEKFITEDPLYLPSEMERKLKWLMREFNSLIQIRKSQLPTKAYNFGEPRIMWVRAFQNTLARNIEPINLLKFNNLLRRLCIAQAIYSLPIKDCNADPCFDADCKTHLKSGFNAFWMDIISGLQHHDRNDWKYQADRTVGDVLDFQPTYKDEINPNHGHSSTNNHNSKAYSRRRREKSKDKSRHHPGKSHHQSPSRSVQPARQCSHDEYYSKERGTHHKRSKHLRS